MKEPREQALVLASPQGGSHESRATEEPKNAARPLGGIGAPQDRRFFLCLLVLPNYRPTCTSKTLLRLPSRLGRVFSISTWATLRFAFDRLSSRASSVHIFCFSRRATRLAVAKFPIAGIDWSTCCEYRDQEYMGKSGLLLARKHRRLETIL